MARILIVEDDLAVRQTIEMVVTKSKLGSIDSATDGESGYAMLSSVSYDVALIDLNLPICNGIELLRRVQPLHIHTEFAIISGIATHADALQAGVCGATAYFEKPLNMKKLVAWIAEVVQEITRHPHQIAQQIDDLLRERCVNAALTISEVAEVVGISTNYVSKLLTQHVGANFTNRLRELRVERAKELLAVTQSEIYLVPNQA